MRILLLASPLMLVACVSAPHAPTADAAASPFPVFRFFEGRTEGSAMLKTVLHHPRAVHVHGHGRIEGGETLVLDQTVEEAGKTPRHRRWRIREIAPGRYAGTLSDASDPVEGDVSGNLLHLAFSMKGGLKAQQWLLLAPDGRSAHNVMVVKKFGVTVAALDETIRKPE